jgi:Putative phage tail protein
VSLGGKKGQSTTDTRLEGISVNQSSYGNAIPLIYGQTRVPLMLLWYGNFLATPHTQTQPGGKGGGGGSSNTTFTYSASMIMGLGEGAITSVGQVWQDKAVTTLAALGLTLFSGAGGQAVWSYLTTNFPSQAVPYDHTAYVAIANLALGSSAALPNYTFEVTGFLPFNTGGSIFDAEPSAVLVDYCTDANHGAAFGALNTAQFQGVGVLTWQSYCIAMGFFFSWYEATQRAAADFIKEMMMMTNSDCWMSAGNLNILPYADTSVTGNGKTYTPNLTPLFAFTDDDLRPNGGNATSGTDPVIVDRQPLANTYNTIVVEYLDRTNAYNVAIAQATDAQDIAVNGVRVMATITLHAITSGTVAQNVAQLILQRQLYIRSTFTFSVRSDYCLLEPMDLVSITDSTLGIVNKLVRITEVDDDANDNITIIAEDMLVGSASAPLYNFQAAQGFAANYNVTPPSVATPQIISAPPALVSAAGGYEIWIATDQGSAGSWGGADVYASLDGTAYTYVGTINGAARYGPVNAALASHADPDTVNTLQVQLTNAATTPLQLVSGTAADFNNLRTLIYVGGEWMAYQTATLVSAGTYNLTNLRRGLYGSAPAAHTTADRFIRIDAGVFRMPYDPGMIGQTMHIKLCSFNIFGKNTQTLAAATDYTHVLAATNAGQLTPGPLTLVGRGVTVNGNSAFKSGGVDATWDSDVYSLQGYANGAFVTFQPSQITLEFMMGLNADPALDSSYTSIDYAFYCEGTATSPGALAIFESGTSIGTVSAYVVGDILSITYDGAFVRYMQNGIVRRQVPAVPNQTFYLDSSFYRQQAAASNLQFGPYGTATPVLYIARGVCIVSDEAAVKQGGSSTWANDDIYSINGFQSCHAVWKSNILSTSDFFIGLSQVIATTPNFTTIDFGIELENTGTGVGNLFVYESGTNTGAGAAFSPYSSADLFAITYDGSTITYWKNGVSMRTVAIAGKTFYLTSAFFAAGSGCNSLEFGPGAVIPLADTAQLGANAASQMVATWFSGVFPATVHGITVAANSTTALTSVFTQSITTTGSPVAIDLIGGLSAGITTGGATAWSAAMTIYRDGSPISTSTTFGMSNTSVPWSAALPQSYPAALTFVDASPPAGSHTYAIMVSGTVIGGTATMTNNVTQCSFKIREIKR